MRLFMYEILENKCVVNELLIVDKPQFCHSSVKLFQLLSTVRPELLNVIFISAS